MADEEMPEVRLDRLGLLVDQLTEGVELSRLRIDGIGDEEYLWEPTHAMWSVRPRDSAATPDAFGPGEAVMDFDRTVGPFDGGPMTTIAWRASHLWHMFAGRYEWTFGGRRVPPNDVVDFSLQADVTFGGLWDTIDRWVSAVGALSDAELDQVGFGQYPWGLDPELPFIGIVRWVNREVIHHLAEIALMRDLYARRS